MGNTALEQTEEIYEGRVMFELSTPGLSQKASRLGHACNECSQPPVYYGEHHGRIEGGNLHPFKYYYCKKHGLEYMAIHGITAGKL